MPPGAERLIVSLENGLQGVAKYHRHPLRMLTGCIGLRTGFYDDPDGKEGLSHYLEHALMDKHLQQKIKKRGGMIKADTGGNCLIIQIALPDSAGNLDFLMQSMRDFYTPKSFPVPDMERERRRIKNEIGRSHDMIATRMSFRSVEAVYGFKNHLTAQMGSRAIVNGITAEDLQDHHAKHFTAGNSVVSVTTPDPAKVDDIQRRLGETFADLPATSTVPSGHTHYRPAETRNNRGTEQLYFSYLLPLQDMAPGDERTAAFYAGYINEKVNETLLGQLGAYEASFFAFAVPGSPGVLRLGGDLLPEDAAQIAPAVADIIGRTAWSVDPETFAIVQAANLGSFAIGEFDWLAQDSASTAVGEMITYGRLTGFRETKEAAEAITPETLTAFARKYVMAGTPSLYAEGYHTLLHSRAEFETLLREAAQPPRPALLPALAVA